MKGRRPRPPKAGAKLPARAKLPRPRLEVGEPDGVAGGLHDALHSLLEHQLREHMPALVEHAKQGRGFMVHIEITNADGSPIAPPPERRIILPNEQ